MSFDLTVFDNDDLPSDIDELFELLETGEVDDDIEPTPRMQSLLDELERRWPAPHSDDSPWASFPLWSPEAGNGCGFNIRWSSADQVRAVMVEACARLGLVLFDPQSDEIIRPPR